MSALTNPADEVRVREIVREELVPVGCRPFVVWRDSGPVTKGPAVVHELAQDDPTRLGHELNELLSQLLVGLDRLTVLVEELNRDSRMAPKDRDRAVFELAGTQKEPEALRELLERRSLQCGQNFRVDAVDSGGLMSESQDEGRHNKTPYVARALTRHVTGAHLTALRWLQRRAWVRRAGDVDSRPSGTNPPVHQG